ncbi:MAG: pitrilysin family protein [Quisquiliibacterium sp.]
MTQSRSFKQTAAAPQRAAGLALLAMLSFVTALWPSLAGAVLPIEHWTTPAGARVYFVRAPSIPMLDISIGLDAGARYDPPGKEGLASMTNAMLAKGVEGLDESAIAERLAMVGAERGGGAGDDRASLTLRTLSSPQELETGVATLQLMLSRPSFPEQILAREKERSAQSLREAQSKPGNIARRAFNQALYGTHPYGRDATPESIMAIGRDELLAFWRDNYTASRAVVSMIGAISREQAEQIAERLTAGLPAGAPAASVPEVARIEQGIDRRIEHPSTQSHILIGVPAIAWGDPDRYALLVGNYVLGGGGFVSRLYDEVREKRGLAYSVYSYFSPSLQPGPFTIGLQTAREQTGTALQVVRDTLERFLKDGPTEQELAAAKANLVGGFALRIDSNRKILDYLSLIGSYGLPLDYLDRWPDRVSEVTLQQVRDAFSRHVRQPSLSTIVVGDGKAPGK